MFYYSKKSRGNIVHCEGCGHINKIKSENLERFETNNEIRGGAYRMCSCCSPVMKKLRAEKAELQKFCGENGLMYFATEICISTPTEANGSSSFPRKGAGASCIMRIYTTSSIATRSPATITNAFQAKRLWAIWIT